MSILADGQLNGPFPLQSGVSTSVRPVPLGVGVQCVLCDPVFGPCFLHVERSDFILVTVEAEWDERYWFTNTTVDIAGDAGGALDGVEYAIERLQFRLVSAGVPVERLEWSFHGLR